MSFPISSSIPLPPKRLEGRFPWRALKVGDSFFVPAKDAGQDGKILYQSAANFRRYRRGEFKASVRKIKGGYRAWRIAA